MTHGGIEGFPAPFIRGAGGPNSAVLRGRELKFSQSLPFCKRVTKNVWESIQVLSEKPSVTICVVVIMPWWHAYCQDGIEGKKIFEIGP